MKVKIGGPRAREHNLDITAVGKAGDPLEAVCLDVGPINDPLEKDSRPRIRIRFTPADVVMGKQLISALEELYENTRCLERPHNEYDPYCPICDDR